MEIVTIVAKNYLPYATVLAESVKENAPDHGMTILIVDADPGEVDLGDLASIATPADLELDSEEFGRMALFYDIRELCTAVKPWALQYLLDQGASAAVYLDPDIEVFGDLATIAANAQDHSIQLTPHRLSAPTDADKMPSENMIMLAGAYNLGFICVTNGAREMLRWWQQRLIRHAIDAPAQGYFTDQRWIDLVPSYFTTEIVKDSSLNVAYWNVDERTIASDSSGITVDGQPLQFFHFSGFRPDKPWQLCEYTSQAPRVALSDDPVLSKLCEHYTQRLKDAGLTGRLEPHGFSRLPDGTEITSQIRMAFRVLLHQAEEDGETLPPNPFDHADPESFREWANTPVAPGSPATKWMLGIWGTRHDLHSIVPDPLGFAESATLADWCLSSGVTEGHMPSRWAAGISIRRPVLTNIDNNSSEAGVNISGYLRAELGVGEVGRILVRGTEQAGLPYSTTESTRTVSRREHTNLLVDNPSLYPINLTAVNADAFNRWYSDAGPNLTNGRYTVGIWAWELEDFPARFDPSFGLVDEVWGISRFTSEAIRKKSPRPVYTVPFNIPVMNEEDIEPLQRDEIGLDEERPYLLFMFDYLSDMERKNPLGLIQAFKQAFDDGEGPTLVIKAINEKWRSPSRERLRYEASRRSDIRLVEGYLSSEQRLALMKEAVAYVSLHRSEGFGLTMAESMALGRPVIATGYSGNLDFMRSDNSLLVPHTLISSEGNSTYPEPSVWADPDLDAAAAAMRKVWENPEWAKDLGSRGQESVRRDLSVEKTAAFIQERVDAILATRTNGKFPPRSSGTPSSTPSALEPAQAAGRPLLTGPLRSFARRALLRILRPYDQIQAERAQQQVAQIESSIVPRLDKIEADLRSSSQSGLSRD
jgi:glycosyltransferase involved in cell wall biosynthesis